MKVALDVRGLNEGRGIQRYVTCLRDALLAGGQDELVETHRPHRHVDVYHSPWIDGAAVRPRAPQVVTLHDLIPLKRRAEYLRTGLRFRLRYLAVQRAARVIVPTQAVAQDAERLLGLTPDRIDVIGYAPAPAMRPRPREEVDRARLRHGLPEEYLLWVGGLKHPDPRKRVAAMAAADRELPLVLVGRAGPWARELHGVILTGRVDDDELAAIYSGARALVFPSDDEGFGLPPVEALACGTPVVASDVPVLREVLGDRATLLDPTDIAGMLRAGAAAQRPAPPPPPLRWPEVAVATRAVYERAVAAGR